MDKNIEHAINDFIQEVLDEELNAQINYWRQKLLIAKLDNKLNWNYYINRIPEKLMEEYINYIDFNKNLLYMNSKLSLNFYIKYIDKINLSLFFQYCSLKKIIYPLFENKNLLSKFKFIHWEQLSKRKLSLEFINSNINNIYLNLYIQYNEVSEEFVKTYKNHLTIKDILNSVPHLSQDYIEELFYTLPLEQKSNMIDIILIRQNASLNFIDKNFNYILPESYSPLIQFNTLNEEFMEKYINILISQESIYSILIKQKYLSLNFWEKHFNLIKENNMIKLFCEECSELNLEFIKKYNIEYILIIGRRKKMSQDLIEELFKIHEYRYKLILTQKIPENILKNCINELTEKERNMMLHSQKLSIDFLLTHLDFSEIIKHRQLKYSIILELIETLSIEKLKLILKYQKLNNSLETKILEQISKLESI